jgi:Cof subfamily protein (haloacid dehalogenase superfamily)
MSPFIVCDIDHTLLNDQGQLVPSNVKALARARAMGATVVLATARSYAGAKLIHSALGLDTPMVVSNGTLICTSDGIVIKAQTIETTLAKQVIDIFAATPHHWSFHNGDAAYIHPKFDTSRAPFNNPLYYKPTQLEHLEQSLGYESMVTATLFGWGLRTLITDHEWQRWPLTLDYYEPNAFTPLEALSVMSSEANKGYAVDWLRRYMHLENAPTLCIGDSVADATMFHLGIGVAPANAPEIVRLQASWVAPHCDDGAVAAALDRFVFVGASTV